MSASVREIIVTPEMVRAGLDELRDHSFSDEHRVVAFNRVRMDPRRVLANVLASAVVGGAVEGLLAAWAFVLVGFVGQQIGFARNVFIEDALHFFGAADQNQPHLDAPKTKRAAPLTAPPAR